MSPSQAGPTVIFRPFAPIPLQAKFPKPGSLRMPAGFARPPLSVKFELNRDRFGEQFKLPVGRFATQSLFAEIPWRLELDTDRKTRKTKDAMQTEFPYPYYIDDDEEEIAVTVTQVEDEDADTDEIEIAAQRIVRFPHPTNRGADLAKSLKKKPRRTPPFLKGAKLFVRFR